jgi:hypothetical protein
MKKFSFRLGSFCAIAAIAFSSLVFTNCKKDKKDPEPEPVVVPPTNSEKLTNKNFRLTASTVDPAFNDGTTLITDVYAQMDACEKDDILRFNTNGTGTNDEGATKCDPDDPQTESFNWVFSTDEKVITVTPTGGTPYSFTVLINDGTTLKVTETMTLGGTKYTFTETYVKM